MMAIKYERESTKPFSHSPTKKNNKGLGKRVNGVMGLNFVVFQLVKNFVARF